MVSYQGMQSGLLVFLVGEFGTFEILCKMTVLQSVIFRISPTGFVKNRTYLDTIIFTNLLCFRLMGVAVLTT